jgi:hypothetical protein
MSRAYVAAGAIVSLLGVVAATTSANSAIVYPWCAQGRISEVGAPSCGFSSFAQCIASFSGGGGTCRENPFYTGPTQPQPTTAGRRGNSVR